MRLPLVRPSIRAAAGAALLLTGARTPLSAQPAPRVQKDQAAVPAGGALQEGVVPGVEVLLRDSLHLLRGKRVGLVTNHSGRDRAGTSTIDLLHRAPGVRLVALFAPEHGIRGAAEAGVQIASATDSATGLPIHSLYGQRHTPADSALRDIDVLVYDIQDVGARVYTYVWTMALTADSANKPFIVLDRPDPIRADRVEGGMLDPQFRSFVGQYPVALRYGLTAGELLRYLQGTGQVTLPSVTVVPMRNYTRAQWWDATRLPWVNPSPNLRDLDATLVYTGTVFFEGTNLSEGRGTDAPFRVVGAPWLTDAGAIAAALNARNLPGVRFDSTSRTIAAGQKHAGLTIPMVQVIVTDRDRVVPVDVGAWLLRDIYARHPRDLTWRTTHMDRLAGDARLRTAVTTSDAAVADLLRAFADESRRFQESTRPYWLYR
ncbi:MAG: exo-beta-N-acetylmuramidase NamZ family protein [Gemmatirosa sp.]